MSFSQIVFTAGANIEPKLWLDSAYLPLYLCAASALLLLVQILRTKTVPKDAITATHYAHTIACVAGNSALLCLSVVTLVAHASPQQIGFTVSFLYAAGLAIACLRACPGWLAQPHLLTVNLSVFVVYIYRDVWPLTTFTLTPMDSQEGLILWAKVAISFFVATVIPLNKSRQYLAIDPENPSAPNQEQTASLFSLVTYSFLDGTVQLAYSNPQVGFEELPALADSDTSIHLRSQTFQVLDPTLNPRKRSVLWGLLYIFRYEYSVGSLFLGVQVVAELCSPLAINNLLSFVETRGEDAVVRPWLWILMLLIAPVTKTITSQWYEYLTTRALVQTEAIVTQLLFEHSLRIRVKSEAPPAASGAASENGDDDDTVKKADVKDERPSSDNLLGKLNNLVTTDLANITAARDWPYIFVYLPLQIAGGIYFLYNLLGWSAFVGLASIVVLAPVPGFIGTLLHGVQQAAMKKTDARVQAVTQMLGVLRMIKLFGWERSMAKKLGEARDEELHAIRWRRCLGITHMIISYLITIFTMISTLAAYTILQKGELTAARIFPAIAVFDLLRDALWRLIELSGQTIAAKVSLDRITSYLRETELLDSFDVEPFEVATLDDEKIGFVDAVFTWSKDAENDRTFALKIEGELFFKRGVVNLVIGSTGVGKTSLLLSLLGELHFIRSGLMSSYNLPRTGGVAYAAQESWVQSLTIRENIIFGAAYDGARYKKVLYQCGLDKDLRLFSAGDLTEVGEKGLTLSGGQKARITLARAVYSRAEILLLDDVLAALDVHTAKWIVEQCFKGELIKGRTVILVTHNIAITKSIADFVVSIGTDGRILSQGTLSDAIGKDVALLAEVAQDKALVEKALEEDKEAKTSDQNVKANKGKLVVAEEVATGRIGRGAFMLLVGSLGGRFPLLFWLTVGGGMLMSDVACVLAIRWLGFWSEQYATHSASEVSPAYHVGVYTLILCVDMTMLILHYLTFLFGQLRASRVVHEKLMASVLGSTLRWLDVTPTSRVIARFTSDIAALDGPSSAYLSHVINIGLTLLVRLFAISVATPFALVVGAALFGVGWTIGQIYTKAQLVVKREQSNARAPVLAQFSSSIAGLTSIRAYGVQEAATAELRSKLDRYTRVSRTFNNLACWIAVRIDLLGALFSSGLAVYLVYGRSGTRSAAEIGFTLGQAVFFSSLILSAVRILNTFEVGGTSLERIKEYLEIDQEAVPTERGQPPAAWPTSGGLRVENLTARYSKDGPMVLNDLSFSITSGSRVGVVGRTGSGKSTLTLALLRGIITEGTVFYDDLNTNNINLESLRANITIIPQVPELLSGSLRQNLDPFELYQDNELNDALRSAGLFSLQDGMGDERITLDSTVSSSGSNLSVGQRQILALARAISRGSKVLILDEATSAIDYKTDTIIQKSLREELPKDVTLITVAHRLQTIMDSDKIMVLDAGRMVEFDSPEELLKRPTSLFAALVNESGDKEALHGMVKRSG